MFSTATNVRLWGKADVDQLLLSRFMSTRPSRAARLWGGHRSFWGHRRGPAMGVCSLFRAFRTRVEIACTAGRIKGLCLCI